MSRHFTPPPEARAAVERAIAISAVEADEAAKSMQRAYAICIREAAQTAQRDAAMLTAGMFSNAKSVEAWQSVMTSITCLKFALADLERWAESHGP